MTDPVAPTITTMAPSNIPGYVPYSPRVVDVEGQLDDDGAYRLFMARHAASQTLSMQRTEWYTKSIRAHVLAAFWLGMGSAVIGIILLIVLVNSTGSSDPTGGLYGP